MSELLPCPSCKGKASVEFYPDPEGESVSRFGLGRAWIKCDQCGMNTSTCRTVEIATFTWNRRPDRALATMLAEALELAIDLISDVAPESEHDAVRLGYTALTAARGAGIEVKG
jgi:hypothetical protein